MNKSSSLSPFFPFDLSARSDYLSWRKQKLSAYPKKISDIRVSINDITELRESELRQLTDVCKKTNTVIYSCKKQIKDKAAIRQLGLQLGLKHLDGNLCSDEDGISGLQVREHGSRHEGYIPYTNKAINWHTDGYYNRKDQQIRAMVLHCVSDAAEGGENSILDHEIAYILLRDHDTDLVKALMENDVMTIPPNIENGTEIRAARSGPVFSVDRNTGNLHMRYTARTRSIEWKNNPVVREATGFIKNLLNSDNEYIFRYRLKPGEGIVSNNALHNRSQFTDDDAMNKHRLFYRARYFDRVNSTDINQVIS